MRLWIRSAEVRGVGGDVVRRIGTKQQQEEPSTLLVDANENNILRFSEHEKC